MRAAKQPIEATAAMIRFTIILQSGTSKGREIIYLHSDCLVGKA